MSETNLMVTRSRTASNPELNLKLVPDFSDLLFDFREYRKKAWEVFQKMPFPSAEDDAWRRTSLKGLNFEELGRFASETEKLPIPKELVEPLADDSYSGQIIYSDEEVSCRENADLSKKGVIFTTLDKAQKEHPDTFKKVLKTATTYQEDKFAALAGAFGMDGIFLYVPKGVRIKNPFHSLLWTSGLGLLRAYQVFVWLEEDASATFVHESSSSDLSSGQNLHAGLLEIHVCGGGKLNFVELQSYGSREWNFTHENVTVEHDAEVDWIFGSLGSHLTKNFSDLNLTGEGAKGKMSGFYFTSGDQHLDHDTQQNHLAANTTSDLLFKGALSGESRSIWQGMIYVAEKAVNADGYQANRNLVLSEKARADSIPGLEILTDEVRCTHGATVGKIDADQIFYLESRGIPRAEAEKLIVEGFFDPIMQRIPFKGVRERFSKAIEGKMNQ